jgi:hypothetical protein
MRRERDRRDGTDLSLQSVERIAQIAQQAVYEIKVAAERQATDWAKRFIASVLPINQKR